MENTINFNFQLNKNTCDKIGKSLADAIVFGFRRARIGETVIHSGYGVITFDESDTQRLHPTLTMGEYNRLKTNAIVFSLKKDTVNKFYDTLIIYHNNHGNDSTGMPSFGYVMLSDDNSRHQINHVCIDYEVFEIIHTLQKEFHSINDLEAHHRIYNKKL